MGMHIISVCNQPPGPTQPTALRATGNDYQLKCGNVLQLGIERQEGSFHSCIDVGGR